MPQRVVDEKALTAPIGGSRSLSAVKFGITSAELEGFGSLATVCGPAAFQNPLCGLPRCSGDVGGDDVSRVPVQAGPGPVVAHRGARVGVRGGLLHIPQRDSRVEGGGDERVAKRVRADVLADPGAAGHSPSDLGGAGRCRREACPQPLQ